MHRMFLCLALILSASLGEIASAKEAQPEADRRSTSYLHQNWLRPFAARMFDETRGSFWVPNGQ